MSLRSKTLTGLVAVALLALAYIAILPATAEAPDYCRTEQGQQDPRCKPDYCETREGQLDPYCHDPEYCVKNPDDPICAKEPASDEKKERCVWYVDGVPVGSVVPILRQSNPGPHAVRLECPNHGLKDWTCQEKAREGGPIPPTGQEDPTCTYHGATVTPGTCAATFLWTVMVPDFNTWTVELSATTYKVEPMADPTGLFPQCVGPVDWNTSHHVVQPDGTVVVKCVLENQYLAKEQLWKQNNTWHHYTRNAEGQWEYHTHPNAASMPDGKIDECDLQYYSIQWRQWN